MQLTVFEDNINLAKEIAAIMDWDLGTIRIEVGNHEITFHQTQRSSSSFIVISKKSNITNKLLRVKLYDNYENVDLFIYRKKPNSETEYHKQSPSKDRLFNMSLEKDIITNYDQLVRMEKLMDDYNDVIQIIVQLRKV